MLGPTTTNMKLHLYRAITNLHRRPTHHTPRGEWFHFPHIWQQQAMPRTSANLQSTFQSGNAHPLSHHCRNTGRGGIGTYEGTGGIYDGTGGHGSIQDMVEKKTMRRARQRHTELCLTLERCTAPRYCRAAVVHSVQ